MWDDLDNLEQYTRKNSLEIQGLPEDAYSSTEMVVIKVAEALNITVEPGFWKFNCSLLNDDNYISELNCNVPKWRTDGVNELSDKRAVWAWIKYNIRAHAIYILLKK